MNRSEMPYPSSDSSSPSPAIGNMFTGVHSKRHLAGEVGPQSLVINSTIHLPALRPRRQVVTNGKPLLQGPGPQSLMTKQQEFGNHLGACLNHRCAIWFLEPLCML
uniref:Uncharacterized protein n=1 Tax=Meleagris gallopavo TaxID=9103 RepID=A0A803XRD6_MELGA